MLLLPSSFSWRSCSLPLTMGHFSSSLDYHQRSQSCTIPVYWGPPALTAPSVCRSLESEYPLPPPIVLYGPVLWLLSPSSHDPLVAFTVLNPIPETLSLFQNLKISKP
jgi:hypothetical protein